MIGIHNHSDDFKWGSCSDMDSRGKQMISLVKNKKTREDQDFNNVDLHVFL